MLLTFQSRKCDLLLYGIYPLSDSLDVVVSVLLISDARDAQQRIIARKTNYTQLLLRMHLTKSLPETCLRTFTTRIKSLSRRSDLLSGHLMRLELLTSAELVVRQLKLALPLSFNILLHYGNDHFIGKLHDRLQIRLLQLASSFTDHASSQRFPRHR